MMTSQNLKFVDFTNTQKSRYLENETLFFLQIKTFIKYTLRATLCQKTFLRQFLRPIGVFTSLGVANFWVTLCDRAQIFLERQQFTKMI